MSFITKRERVFNDLELCDLPARNEGKIKAYASCTDARAWSHFVSSKTEHLTELIKRNNDLSKPVKYVPTKVIVDTLLASKNLEIGKLKRKIEEFEQMLAAYDELDLDCAQKCEIAKAHAAIKAANKDLDELCLNLDISTCTDGYDTESFETGKSRSVQYSANLSIKSKGGDSDRSRGDAWTVMPDKDMVTQGNQTSLVCPCDASVSVEDPRIDEMKEQIISKDAKLSAMRNSLAIMENDICEPFGIYAHIYTALEKIFGVLCQNSKYKQYLNLMTAGKDIRCIDIKGKILFKMKVLEKFCLALIAPCSKDFNCSNENDCPCYYANVSTKMDQSYQLTPAKCTSSDSIKRSQLVADIMENEEMKEILSKESTPGENDDAESDTEEQVFDAASNINEENQKRIKDLQECYEDLLNCYENLKHETDCIRVRCARYEDLELELERLRGQLKEYNSLWNEKEHYRKRSDDLDSLKQQYMVLAAESSGLETKLKAESEINHIKADAIDELRTQNISLEKRLNEIYISLEKDKNSLQCQLQESECKCMCQEQQIKSLNSQINKLLEQQPEPENISPDDTSVSKENESLKEQLKQYQDIEYEFQDKIARISELEEEIARWRAEYEELFERNKHYADCIDSCNNERESLLKENSALRDAIKDKSVAVENLMGIVKIKSLEIHKLTDENQKISSQLTTLGQKYEDQVNLSRQESQELMRKVKDYDDFVQKQEDLSNDIEEKMRDYESVKHLLKSKLEENDRLKNDLNKLQDEDARNKVSLEMSKSKSSIMERKILELEDISEQFLNLKNAFEQLSAEKNGLEKELRKKASQLESAIYSMKLNKKESGELLKQSETIQDELTKLHLNNDSLQRQIDLLRDENKELKIESARLSNLEHELLNLKKAMNELLTEKAELEHSFKLKEEEISNMHNSLENKILENQLLMEELDNLKSHHLKATKDVKNLENENELHQSELDRCKRESSVLIEKLQSQDKLENELKELKTDYENIKLDKDRLKKELEAQLLDFQNIKQEKSKLQRETDELLAHNNDLEKIILNTRNEQMQSSPSDKPPMNDLIEEVQKLKDEKIAGQQKIRELLHQLDESGQVIANFEDEIQARDHRIATMQNQINALEDEVQKLRYLLEQALDAGNDIKNTNLSIDQARKQIEAHHSKASHNMKLELAVLQQNKSKLEDQLSITKSQYEISSKDKQNYFSEVFDLKNDREIIVTDIKQLEMYSVGDSELTSDDCEIERILHSIDRIRKAFEGRHAKTVSLEQTLAKVQASSQLVLNKADEAKTKFENEKQRILNEKEDAIKEKNNLAKQLIDLKNDLNDKISRDAVTINDLEAEITNQKLIIDKINEMSQKYIMTLENEIQSLKDLYEVALSNIRELQDKLSTSTAKNDEKESMIKNIIKDLENKTREASELKFSLSNLHETWDSDNYKDVSSQTDNIEQHASINLSGSDITNDNVPEQDIIKTNKSEFKKSIKPMYDLLPQKKPPSVNEVQILAAEAKPTFDFVRSSYLNYKLKRLSPGLLEHHSIASLTATSNSKIEEGHAINNNFAGSTHSNKSQEIGTHASNEGLIDIYYSPQKKSIKPMYDLLPQKKPPSVNEVQILAAEAKPTFDFVRSSYLNYKLKRLSPGLLEHHSIASLTATSNSKIEEGHAINNNFAGSTHSNKSQEIGTHASNEGLIDIYYSPSDGIQTSSKIIDISIQQQYSLDTSGQTSDVSEDVTPSKHHSDSQTKVKSQNRQHFEKPLKISDDSEKKSTKSNVKFEATTPLQLNEMETGKAKRNLNISLPRVGIESNIFATTTENDNISLDSNTLSTSSHPVKKSASGTTINIPSSTEYETKAGSHSLQTISNSDDIDMKSRSFIEIPSKDTSYKKTSNPSDSRTSTDNYIIYENRKVKVKTPQQIFAFTEQLQRHDYKADNVRFVTNDDNEPTTGKTSEYNDKLESFTKFDDSEEFYLKNKKSQKGNVNTEVDDPRGLELRGDNRNHLPINKKGNEHIGKIPQQKHHRMSKNDNSYLKDKFATDTKNRRKIGKISSDESISDLKEKSFESEMSHDIAGLESDDVHKISKSSSNLYYIDDNDDKTVQERHSDFALAYILDTFKPDPVHNLRNDLISTQSQEKNTNEQVKVGSVLNKESTGETDKNRSKSVDQSSLVKLDTNYKYYDEVITGLRKSVEDAEKEHKMQIEAIKVQYDRNIRSIINEHNQGVMSIQGIHEETLRDFMRVHENEVENLRTMSIEAMRKVEKLEKECKSLKSKISLDPNSSLHDEMPTKGEGLLEVKIPRTNPQSDTKVLSKTALEAFDVKPKPRAYGPCTCSLDTKISDTIRNIFQQVDVDQRNMAEITYLKYIATKITNGHIEALDTQELSFLHLKVCRIWKQKLYKEEALQKKLDSLEVELIRKQRYAQQHMADLDRKVAQEKRRLEEVREAVCGSTPLNLLLPVREALDSNCSCPCNVEQAVAERQSAGDLTAAVTGVLRTKRKGEHKAAMTRTAAEEKRNRRLYTDEPPTRLRRPHDRPQRLAKKKP